MEKVIERKQTHYTPAYIVNTCITLFFMFIFGWVVPPFSGISEVGMRVLGVFIGTVYGYSTCDIIWPSILAFVALGLTGYCTVSEAINSMMGQNVVFQCICAFVTAGALTHYGFGKWFVRWSLSRKAFKGKPIKYTWCFLTVFGLSALLINQIALMILLMSIWLDISDSCGYERDSSFLYAGMGGILFCTLSGAAMVPYTSWVLGLCSAWVKAVGAEMNYGVMGVMCFFITVISASLYVLCMVKVWKVDFSKMQAFDVEKMGDESKHLRPRAVRIGLIYLVTVAAVILGNTLPAGSLLRTLVNNNITTAGMFAICLGILLILPSGEHDGKPALEWNAIHRQAISWNCILMVAVCLTLASAVTDNDLGVKTAIVRLFAPILSGRSGWFIIFFVCLVALILTNLGSNIAFGVALIPVVAPYVVESGLNPVLAGSVLLYTVSLGLVIPAASGPASIFHSNAAIPNAGKRMYYQIWACGIALVSGLLVFSIGYLLIG